MTIEDLRKLLEEFETIGAPIEEMQLLKTLYAEEEWRLLPDQKKQAKRKFTIKYIERISEDPNIDLEYEKSIIELYQKNIMMN